MECGNLVTINDCYGPPTLYGMQEPCYLSMTVMVPHTLYMNARNLVSVYD